MVRCHDLVGDLFPHVRALLLERVFFECGVVRLVARTQPIGVACHACWAVSIRVHSVYVRRLEDTPVGDRPVVIELTVRRLYCENVACTRRTFAEQVDGLTLRYGRRTPSSRRLLEAVAVALAGRAGARLAAALHIKVSRTTLLRAIMALSDPAWAVPNVLGVDDFATRRGHHYGTVLIDCETGQSLDLLTGWDAATLAGWLREHPGAEIICRDRAGCYADGARTGAPNAVQVADRFHLWQNLGTAVEASIRLPIKCLKTSAAGPDGPTNDGDSVDATKAMSPIEARIRERHATIRALLAQGHGIREIARELRIGGNTVRRNARAAVPEQLLTGRHQPRPSQLDPYKSHLDERWAVGHTNAIQLHAELQALGHRGSYQIISDYLRPRRRRRIRVVPPPPPGIRRVTGWMMRHPERLGDEEREQFAAVLARCPELKALHAHVRGFAEILQSRSGQHLKDWIAATRTADLSRLHAFATGLEKDWDAVVQGLRTHWNSGPAEGRVHHIKMIKRQMFGRAKLPLLRKRVLLTAAQAGRRHPLCP
ncbi:ISL3 family transposase [Streptomyces sp. NPDC096079]|uniref:ISL3 family transposase n=1 Tax=Streptomyces sp. NPDC096079 TaxID=3155820 RepID=UPI00332188A1